MAAATRTAKITTGRRGHFGEVMTADEFLLVLVTVPLAFAIGAWLGRKYQRFAWHLDEPYDERAKGFKS